MLKLAIDFGTAETKIYQLGSGIVLAEATCVTVDRDKVRAFGDEAKKLYGKSAETQVIFPVREGDIADEELAAALLRYFLGKIVVRRTSVEAAFCVPCGCGDDLKGKYLRVARKAGLSRADFIETPYLAALGHDIPLNESNPIFAMDVGAGKTSIAVFSLDGIIAGLTMNVGGNNMDVHIIDHIAALYNLKIGPSSAERLKNTAGSLVETDNQSAIVDGRDITTGKPRSVNVYAGDIRLPITVYLDKILEYAELILRKLPAEVSAAMCRGGVLLTGGVCALPGIGGYIADSLQMETHIAENPDLAIVLGGGRALGNPALFKKIKLA